MSNRERRAIVPPPQDDPIYELDKVIVRVLEDEEILEWDTIVDTFNIAHAVSRAAQNPLADEELAAALINGKFIPSSLEPFSFYRRDGEISNDEREGLSIGTIRILEEMEVIPVALPLEAPHFRPGTEQIELIEMMRSNQREVIHREFEEAGKPLVRFSANTPLRGVSVHLDFDRDGFGGPSKIPGYADISRFIIDISPVAYAKSFPSNKPTIS